LEEWRRKDPIDRFLRHLIDSSLATQEELNAIDQKIDASLEEDLAWTESQALFQGEDAAKGVFA
jgi:TPP-dependent pyruvate/acetoin dehydrogenase alpha subunit